MDPIYFKGAGMRVMTADGEERADLLVEYVVTPSGQIKSCYYERNVQPALLHMQWIKAKDGHRIIGVSKISVPERDAKDGYVLLRDLYEAEGRMQDFEAFKLYKVQAVKRHVTVDIDDAYMPDEVLRRRRDYVKQQRTLELPPPQPRAEKKAGKSRAQPRRLTVADMLKSEVCRFYPKAEAQRLARNALARLAA